jgi:hypothetical protein
MNYTYETTYEDESPDGTVRVSAEVRITYTVNWGCPARIHYDENDHPAEGDELEITKVQLETYYGDRTLWRDATRLENDLLSAWINDLREEMLVEARERDKGEM